MADRPTEPTSARRPSNSGREDTVVRPLPAQPAQPAPQDSQAGNGKVLPPMPPAESTNGSRNGSANGAPAKRPSRPPAKARPAQPPPQGATQPTQPTQPPAQARRPATKPAPTPGVAAAPPARPTRRPAARPAAATPTVAAPPVVPPTAPVSPVDAPAPQARVAPAKKVKPPKPAKPTREERRAEKVAAAPKPGRRARLRLTRIDPWSVMKTSFLLSIALGIVTVVSVLMVWSVLGAADVWSSINQTVQDVVGGQDASTFDIEDYLGTRRVVGFTMIVAAVDVVLLTAICTLGAFLYNMSASLLGGVEVTLAEDN